MKVTNSVYRGSLPSAIPFAELETRCIQHGYSYKHHKGRPVMFRISLPCTMTLLIFQSGRFRLMGKCQDKAVVMNAVIDFVDMIPDSFQYQSATLSFKVNPPSSDFAERHGDCVDYVPELFPAMKLRRWPDIYVNLFFTGSVIVMGANALQRAEEVKAWLDIETAPKPDQPMEPTIPQRPNSHMEATKTILSTFPEEMHPQVRSFLTGYPTRLVISWGARILTDMALQSQLRCNISKYAY